MIYFVLLLLYYNTLKCALASNLLNETLSCNVNITSFKGQVVNLSKDCTDKPCLPKCCGENEILVVRNRKNLIPRCTKITKTLEKKLRNSNVTFDYSDLKLYRSDIETQIALSTKQFLKDLIWVQNKILLDNNCSQVLPGKAVKILDNGKLAVDQQNQMLGRRWHILEVPSYCVELKVECIKNVITGTYEHYSDIKPETGPDEEPIIIFLIAGFLISSFFLLLVLLIYCVLPQLQNLAGMILMAYSATMLVVNLLRVYSLSDTGLHIETCKVFSPIFYFSVLSSFLWLNITSFDIWWTFRGARLKRQINKKGEVVKFLWYCSFAWGVAALMTTAAVLVEEADLSHWPTVLKPNFKSCLHNELSFLLYLTTPMGILVAINIVLFLMTVYNMWLINKGIDGFSCSSNTKSNRKRFRLFTRMSLLMGISWVLEVLQAFLQNLSFWKFILLNFYNTLIGVAIFFMFVFNMRTLFMLCKRFNINIKFVQDWKLNKARKKLSRPSTSKGLSTSTKTRENDFSDHEMTELSITDSKHV